MELSLRVYSNRILYFAIILISINGSLTALGQTLQERIYEEDGFSSEDDYLLGLGIGSPSGYVENANAAVDQDLSTFATLNSTTVNVLSLGILGGDAAIRLNFPSTVLLSHL